MLYNLSLSKNAQFYILNKKLTKKSIQDAFKEISANRIGNNLINDVKKHHLSHSNKKSEYSMIAYKFEEEPSFLVNSSIKEIKYAYLLLIESEDTLVILKKHIDSPEKFFDDFISEFDYEKFCHFLGGENPSYEKITMKNMSISNAVIRSRSLEAASLNGIISSNSSSRSIPSSFRMRVGQDFYSLTPNSSRISHRDKKSDIDEIINWIIDIKNEINKKNNASEFLNNFAKPISLDDIIKSGVKITAILIDLSQIEEKITNGIYMLEKKDGTPLTKKESDMFFNQLQSPIHVENNKLKTKGVFLAGKIKTATKVITIDNKILNEIFIIEKAKDKISIGSYINKNKPFSAVFDSPNYSYFSKSTFEDKKLLNNIKSILNIFDDRYDFSRVRSEKEKPHNKNITQFPDKSLFYAVEKAFSSNSKNIIICDDMNDEWADHIIVDSKSALPSISFIHSKFTKNESYGASKFHDVVAQALKNIGRTQSDKSAFEKKYNNEWNKCYENTKINRVKGANNWSELSDALDVVYQNPNSIKKIILATPFLKKSILEEELTKLSEGTNCKPHYVQLIWLINTFISSCKEFGVQAHILCKP